MSNFPAPDTTTSQSLAARGVIVIVPVLEVIY
jgi:hypothetical protein